MNTPKEKGVYVHFPLVKSSADHLKNWVKDVLLLSRPTWDLHVTTVYSRKPFIYQTVEKQGAVAKDYIADASSYGIVLLQGKEELGLCLALRLNCQAVWVSHVQSLLDGATWDYPSSIPHLTLAYNIKLEDILGRVLFTPPGKLIFEKEVVRDLDENWQPQQQEPDDAHT